MTRRDAGSRGRPGIPLLAAMLGLCVMHSAAQTGGADSAAAARSAGSAGSGAFPDSGLIAGPPGSASAGLILSVTSEPSGARVYLDGAIIGTTPVGVPLGRPAGDGAAGAARDTVRVTVIGGDPDDWFVPVVTDSLSIPDGGPRPDAAGDTLRRHYLLPIAARITSSPTDALVLLGDSLLGRTPLFATLPGPGVTVSLRKDGFVPQTVLIGPGSTQFSATLAPVDPSAAPEPSVLAGASGKSRTMLFVSAGTAVVTGAAAAWLKNRADNSYEDFRAGGDPGTLDRVRRYDLLSGIALSVAEISLGYLIIELLSR